MAKEKAVIYQLPESKAMDEVTRNGDIVPLGLPIAVALRVFAVKEQESRKIY
jgi:hypothetical protein